MDELPTSRQIDPLALFKEINEFVSFHELLEPLSPYSSDSDSDSSSSSEDHPTSKRLIDSIKTRVKTRFKHVSNRNGNLKDPSDDKLFQMLTRGARKKARTQSLDEQNSLSFRAGCEPNSMVNTDSTKTKGKKNSGKGGARMQRKHQQQSLVDDFPLTPCATSSLHNHHHSQQQQQQLELQHANVNCKSALVELKSLRISERRSYFNTHDNGLAKYPDYIDYHENIKKPFKQIEDMTCGPSGSNLNSLGSVGTSFDCSISPPSPDLNPDILSALNCLFPSN